MAVTGRTLRRCRQRLRQTSHPQVDLVCGGTRTRFFVSSSSSPNLSVSMLISTRASPRAALPRLALGDQLFCCRHRGLLHVGSQCGSKIDKPVHRCDADSQNIRENRHQPPLVQSCKVIGPLAHPARRIPVAGAFSNDTNVSRAAVLSGRARISCSSITVRSSSR